MKVCSRCGVEKPIEAFHRNSHGTDGRLTYCADCKTIYPRTTKLCRSCGEVKERRFFHRNKSLKDGYVNQCKSCKRAADAMRYQSNKRPSVGALMAGWGR